MGMFDSVHTGTRCGQTKAFDCILSDLVPGDAVNRADSQYAMHEGGWLIVRDGRIVDWVDEADPALPRYDNGANPLTGDPGDGYHYDVPTRERTAERQAALRRAFGRTGDATDADVDAEHDRAVASATGRPHDCTICDELNEERT